MMKQSKSSSTACWVTIAMLAMVILPAALTLHTVHSSTSEPEWSPQSSPFGYTVSLLLFIVPSLSISLWFLPHEGLTISRRAFGWTIGILFPIGAGLDFFLAQFFFVFPNQAATIGIKAPALGGWVPIEEYVFYLSGFITIVLLYIWFDEYWLAAYSVPPGSALRITFDRLLKFHPASFLLAAAAVVAATVYKRDFSSEPGRFPGYFVFLVLFALLPSSLLLPAARPVINWRALSLTMFMLLNTSLLWEVTLAVPYGWWNFNDAQMLGIRITAWHRLPVEEVVVWLAVTYASIIVYETAKRWKASGRLAKDAMLGTSRPGR